MICSIIKTLTVLHYLNSTGLSLLKTVVPLKFKTLRYYHSPGLMTVSVVSQNLDERQNTNGTA